ncbi:hypothetical protein SAMN05443245_0286 [Paraburkholderia fungorum]|uniref:Uncharacterized protein n=1 Tax=Paraburkholderia fungorum TaxID=134537 RepID=A0A1H0YU61_9BURK|nr:hypothetical protein [Paraburkholderia fungorum]SDQ18757.1 hypothetical protein SAMN05443245_0286 [Paraburkholderia fungorum]
MSESLIAYLLGPAVMLLVGVAIWASSHYRHTTKPPRLERWLDTHYAEWLHHRH